MVGRYAFGVVVVLMLILSACGEDPQPAFETPAPSTTVLTTTTTTLASAESTTSTTTVTTAPASSSPPRTAPVFCESVDTPTVPIITAQVGDLDGDELPDGLALFDNEDGSGLLLVSSTEQGPIGMEIPEFFADIYTEASITGADIDKNGDVELFFPVRKEADGTRIDQILEPGDCVLTPVQLGGTPFELHFQNSGQIAAYRCGNGTVVTVAGAKRAQDSTATVYQVVDGTAEKRYEFQTGSNVTIADGVGQRCSGVANRGPGPRPPG